jgi:hypothetical protein
MDNLFAHIHRDFIHVIDEVLEIIPGDLIIVGVPVDVPPVADRFDMLSGDPYKHLTEF